MNELLDGLWRASLWLALLPGLASQAAAQPPPASGIFQRKGTI